MIFNKTIILGVTALSFLGLNGLEANEDNYNFKTSTPMEIQADLDNRVTNTILEAAKEGKNAIQLSFQKHDLEVDQIKYINFL
ncbi:MAG: hypothetical protein K940chlam3_01038 [Chlamydiae bacterium]|nr:hypothetical protein [Chlamydiota bacterium]